MTIYAPQKTYITNNNNLVKNAAAANPNIKIADWYSLASANTDWFTGDPLQVHPNNVGDEAFAQLIADTISNSGINPSGSPQTTKSNCVITKVGNPTGPTPVCLSGNSGDLKQTLIDQFGLTMNGFEDKFLQWTLEMLQASSSTNFSNLINGATVEVNCDGCGGKQVGCKNETSIYLEPYDTSAAYFKFILTHELGHFIRNCHTRETSKYNEHINAIYIDRFISYYAENASSCANTSSNSEDYADTIAYFINPDSGHVSGPIDCPTTGRTPPNPLFELIPIKTEHLNVAQQIL